MVEDSCFFRWQLVSIVVPVAKDFDGMEWKHGTGLKKTITWWNVFKATVIKAMQVDGCGCNLLINFCLTLVSYNYYLVMLVVFRPFFSTSSPFHKSQSCCLSASGVLVWSTLSGWSWRLTPPPTSPSSLSSTSLKLNPSRPDLLLSSKELGPEEEAFIGQEFL